MRIGNPGSAAPLSSAQVSAAGNSLFQRWPAVASVAAGSTAAIVAADLGKLFTIAGVMGGALATRTLPIATDVFNGWSVEVKNTGMSILRLSPLGGLTLDGSATLDILPGQEGRIIFDGANYITRGISKRVWVSKQSISTQPSITIALPPGYRKCVIEYDRISADSTGMNIMMRLALDGVPTFITSAAYYESYVYQPSNTASGSNRQSAQSAAIVLNNQGNNLNAMGAGRVTLELPAVGAGYTTWEAIGHAFSNSDDRETLWYESGMLASAQGRATHAQIYPSIGAALSGTFSVEGIV